MIQQSPHLVWIPYNLERPPPLPPLAVHTPSFPQGCTSPLRPHRPHIASASQTRSHRESEGQCRHTIWVMDPCVALAYHESEPAPCQVVFDLFKSEPSPPQ